MEQEKVVQFQLDYSEDIIVSLIGTPNEIANFLFTEDRGEEAAPITVFAPDEAGNPVAIPPQESYGEQLRSIEEELASGRGAAEAEDPVSERVLLPDGFLPFLDELPEWLQPNVIRPRTGFLAQPALLPRSAVEEWYRGLAALEAIAGQYDLPVERAAAPIAARGLTVRQRFEGFLIVAVKNKGLGCREWVLDSSEQGSNSLRVYTFQSRDQEHRAQCKVSSGRAEVEITANGAPWRVSPGALTPGDGSWPADAQSSVPNNATIITAVRNPGPGTCAYALRGGCLISGNIS